MYVSRRHFVALISLVIIFLFIPDVQAQLLTGYNNPSSKNANNVISEHIEVTNSNKTVNSNNVSGDPSVSNSAVTGQFNKQQPVDMTADSLSHNDETQVVTATGNVVLRQEGRVLKADKVSYNLQSDTVTAMGNVSLREPNGDVHFVDEVVLSNKMKDGFVKGVNTYLVDGGHFVAEEGTRGDNKIIMTSASYTPCECETDNQGNPAWQIKANEVTYHEDEHRISYRNAWFEMFGIPLAWLPYLSHPDGQEDQKSGFLTPVVGYDSYLGGVLTNEYYWAVAPDKDVTIGAMLTTRELPVALAEYRQRFANAELEISGSTTYSGYTDSIGGQDVEKDEELRGHFEAEGLWNITDKWRAGLDLEISSDDQYMRQYDFSNKDVLENEIYVERFSGRNYGIGRVLAFQDVRIRESQEDQPNILPEVVVSMLGDPGQTLGGRWSLDLSLLSLERNNGGQDMDRIVSEAGWQGRYVTNFGLVNTAELGVRGDVYYVRDRDVATTGSGRSNAGSETRGFAYANIMSSYPLVRDFDTVQVVIEPTVALTLAPSVNSEDTNIPNEDSQDVQLDVSNLFESNRFPGKDRIEDDSHVTYGMRTGLYSHRGNYADVFVGQSHRFDDKENPFPVGSGLSEQDSDIVGQIAALYQGHIGMNYRFQLDSEDMSSQRHEFDGFAKAGPVHLNTRYLFAESLEGTDINETREQLENALSYDVTNSWRARGSALHDLGEDSGLRKASIGLDYVGCCLSFSTTAERTLTTDASGDSGTSVWFKIGLKGIGEFQAND